MASVQILSLLSDRTPAARGGHFSGEAWTRKVFETVGPNFLRVYRVTFAPGARTHWHCHNGPQLLVVLQGLCRVQQWEGASWQGGAGALVLIPAGAKHWHGAAPEGPMTHLAFNLGDQTSWMEAVSEGDYARAFSKTGESEGEEVP